MSKKVEIINRKEVFRKAIFRIDEVRLRHELYGGGMSDELMRLNLDRGDSVAALVHDTTDDSVLLTEQFRYPTYDKGPGWILEVPAGILGPDEDPADAMKREIEEEIGYVVDRIRHISTFFLSPGGTSERIHLFYARVTPRSKASDGGGVSTEGEDIRVVRLPVSEALSQFRNGQIVDAKTILALQWLEIDRLSA